MSSEQRGVRPGADTWGPPPQLGHEAIDVRVTERLLWIGEAAYPLANVTRIHTFLLRPRYGAAGLRFLRQVTTAALALLLLLVVAENDRDVREFADAVAPVWLALLVFFLVQLLSVWFARSHFVLAVETAGSSTAVVTSRSRDLLRGVVGRLAHAIEHPGAEFVVRVERLSVNARNYHFGDTVHINGGVGNTGVKRT
ncbi:DUF6232 family protein [Streptomyces avicenniae]|uniref:DUF6232 family protein n=1 Tax=Streptomyces avicenniae TaxID=500153 RepID=UPI000699763C|nr:DUF6232 family protein [Streptomyces avicenniae]